MFTPKYKLSLILISVALFGAGCTRSISQENSARGTGPVSAQSGVMHNESVQDTADVADAPFPQCPSVESIAGICVSDSSPSVRAQYLVVTDEPRGGSRNCSYFGDAPVGHENQVHPGEPGMRGLDITMFRFNHTGEDDASGNFVEFSASDANLDYYVTKYMAAQFKNVMADVVQNEIGTRSVRWHDFLDFISTSRQFRIEVSQTNSMCSSGNMLPLGRLVDHPQAPLPKSGTMNLQTPSSSAVNPALVNSPTTANSVPQSPIALPPRSSVPTFSGNNGASRGPNCGLTANIVKEYCHINPGSIPMFSRLYYNECEINARDVSGFGVAGFGEISLERFEQGRTRDVVEVPNVADAAYIRDTLTGFELYFKQGNKAGVFKAFGEKKQEEVYIFDVPTQKQVPLGGACNKQEAQRIVSSVLVPYLQSR